MFYKTFPLNVAFLRGTTADPNGNVTGEREALLLDDLAMAMAVKNSGGVAIVRVERIARTGSLPGYSTSAFMRITLGQVLTHTVRLHIFESKAEAQAFHEQT